MTEGPRTISKEPERLQPVGIKSLGPGMHHDGNGLYLQVRPKKNGGLGRCWVLRYSLAGQNRHMGFGRYPGITLAKARELAVDARAKVQQGIDPMLERREIKQARAAQFEEQRKAKKHTLKAAADAWYKHSENKWTSPVQRRQVAGMIAKLPPALARKPIKDVTDDDALDVLMPIHDQAPVSARRARMWLAKIFDWAAAHKWRSRKEPNPARWKGHIEYRFDARSIRDVEHHAKLPYKEAPAFAAELRAGDTMAHRALEFLLLTAARSADVTEAKWDGVDLQSRVWTIPKTKNGNPLKVPLSDRAVAILDQLPQMAGNHHVFPGALDGKGLGKRAFRKLMDEMRPGYPPHGLRGTFKTWASETKGAGHEPDVIETALAHTVGNMSERAYQGAEYLEQRGFLMQHWADYLQKPPATADVLTFKRA